MLCNVSSTHVYPPCGTFDCITLINSAGVADSIANIEHDARGQALLVEAQYWRWLYVELGRIEALEKDLSGL